MHEARAPARAHVCVGQSSVVQMGSKDSSVPGRRGLLRLARQGHGILAPSWTRNNHPMPELPDLRILAEAFTASLGGRPLSGWHVTQALVLSGTSGELEALVGQRLERVDQRGKFLTFQLSRDRVVINAMLTGRLGSGPPEQALAADRRDVHVRRPVRATHRCRVVDARRLLAAARRRGRRAALPRPEADGQGVRGPGAWSGHRRGESSAPTPTTPHSTFDLAGRIARHTGELPTLLKNRAFVAGIGNGYSDEVLWAARLAPFRKRSSLADEEVERLWRATPEVMRWAIGELRERARPASRSSSGHFLKVHRKGGQACPRCGTTLSEVSPGGFVTTWCVAARSSRG